MILTVFMWCFKTRGGGRDLSTAGKAVLHSLMLLKMGRIVARNMSS